VRKIKVLVVDDSAAIRRLLSDILSADPEIEVVGTAASGVSGLSRVREVEPDIVTLDVDMPDMDGLTLLTRLRATAPRLPVIMFSALTERAGATTLEALSRGAVDYVTKPAGSSNLEASIQHVREQLLPRIKCFGRRRIGADATATVAEAMPALAPASPRGLRRRATSRVELVAVGSSTGGPNALVTFFQQLPAGLPVPFVIVQHMPPVFTRMLAERLSACCHMPFHEVRDGDVLTEGQGWIAPGNYHLRVVRDGARLRAALDQSPPENSCRPAADVLFRSVAATHGSAVLAVVLTGMGQDGLRGCEDIVERGGRVIVQDESSSIVWGMPGMIARAGLADAVLPLADLAAEVLRRLPAAARVPATNTDLRSVS
jgi:two-component system, chemotaxis family, protein-glutamate methylesterase/glutaminase